MSIRDDKMDPQGGTIRDVHSLAFAPAISLTAAIVRILQIPYAFAVIQVAGWCRVLAGAVSANVGIVRPGGTAEGVTLVIGTTKSKFKSSVAFNAVMPIGSLTQLGDIVALVHKAIEDDIEFSTAFTVNAAAATGQTFWGACRVQMDSAGVVSTKVRSADQAYNLEAEALYAVPDADANKVDCGTITFEAKSGQTFTAGTTELDNATVLNDVNYDGADSAFASVLDDPTTDPVTYVSAAVDTPAMVEAIQDRGCEQAGGALVVKTTTDGSGALTDGTLDITVRVWPANGEVAPRR